MPHFVRMSAVFSTFVRLPDKPQIPNAVQAGVTFWAAMEPAYYFKPRHICPKLTRAMPSIYYCQSANRGILRAVLSWEAGRNLLRQLPFHYAGQQFPTKAQDRPADFAVLRIFDEELDKKWRAGFYRLDADIMRIEEAVQACTTKLSEVRGKQAKRQIFKHAEVKNR